MAVALAAMLAPDYALLPKWCIIERINWL